jgi:hypothetical protein
MTEAGPLSRGLPVAAQRMLAVGAWGGVMSGFVGIPDGHAVVRLADELISLDEDEYKIWTGARLSLAADALLEQARLDGVAEPARTLSCLQTEGLVIAAADGPDAARQFARKVTAVLTGDLVGNGPYRSPQFSVRACPASPQLVVDALVYQFLVVADGSAPIVDLCAKIEIKLPGPAVDVVAHVVTWLPFLLRSALIRLDLPASARPERS